MNNSILDNLELIQEIPITNKTFPKTHEVQNKLNLINTTYQTNDKLKQSVSTRPSTLASSIKSMATTKVSFPSLKLQNDTQMCDVRSNYSRLQNKDNINKITQNDKFNCHSCINDLSENCQICHGKRQLNGNDKLIKFFEFVLEFKLGKRESYKPQTPQKHIRINKTVNKNPNQHCNLYYSTFNHKSSKQQPQLEHQIRYSMRSSSGPSDSKFCFRSKQQHQQLCKNFKQIHYSFNCDKCSSSPIIGLRYHCNDCENFDLCEDCFYREGHYHQMQKIQPKKNQNQKTMDKISNLLKAPSNINNLRSSISNIRNSIRNTVASSSKVCKSWIH